MKNADFSPLQRRFYRRDSLALARELLGRVLVRRLGRALLVGRIVETEAYGGLEDKASHAFGGLKNRNAPMFASGGFSYVYFTYGSCHCFNVVSGEADEPQAVLIRALEPVAGLSIMRRLRARERERDLCSGPGKICQALAIDKSLNAVPLWANGEIWLGPGVPVGDDAVARSARIGLSERAGEWRFTPWRFYLKDNPFVSGPGKKIAQTRRGP